MTNWQSIKILSTTTSLEIDNRKKPFKIIDNWNNIKSTRRWEFVYLSPWENKIVITREAGDLNASVTIKYRATFE